MTDAGANTMVRTTGGTTSTEFVMPTIENDRDGVPTGIARAADGTTYVAGLGVYEGQSRIYKVGPNGPEVWVSGLSNVVDLAVAPNGDLIAQHRRGRSCLSHGKGFERARTPLLLSRWTVKSSYGGETREHSYPWVLPQPVTVRRLTFGVARSA